MSEGPDHATTADELRPGGPKPGGDYGDVSGIGTSDARTEGDGPDDGPAGPAEPDEQPARRAQDGVQESFE